MNSHLTTQQMLKYVDGELSKSEMILAEGHLHSCWTCLTEVEHLKDGIVTILDAHNEHFVPSLPPPPGAWPNFQALLARKLPEKPNTLRERLVESLNALFASTRILAVSGIVVMLLVCGYAFFHVKTVSAKEILRRVQAADAQRSIIKADQVIRERVHIRKTTRGRSHVQVANVETWKSSTAAYWNIAESDPAARDLMAQYQAHAIPVGLPLSAAAIGLWGKAAGGPPVISREGPDMDLSFAREKNGELEGVERVTLLVQPETWQVKRMTLDLAEESFEVTEDDYSVISMSDLPANLLALLEPVAPSTVNPQRAVSIRSGVASNAIHLPVTNLDKAQLDVFLKLHNLKADLGEPVTVTRTSQAVEVGIWQLPADRQDELRDALAGEAGVQLELTAPRSLPKQERAAPPLDSLTAVADIPLPSQIESGGDDRHLLTYFGTSEREQNFTNEALGTHTAILSHLYALRNLGVQFPEDKSGVLALEEEKQLRLLVQDHVTAIASSLDALSRQLSPLEASFGVPPCAPSETAVPKNWQSGSVETLKTARVVDHLLRAVFTTSQTPATPSSALPQIEQNLCRLQSDMKSLDEYGIY